MKINHNFLKAWNIKEPIDVPIRKNNQTMTSPEKRCHQNVASMQMKNGGLTVLGFAFYDVDCDNTFIVEPHSVWQTPEGKYIDVSLATLGDDSIKFAPIKHYDANKEFYDIYESYILKPDQIMRTFNGDQTHSYDFFKNKDLTQLVFHRPKSVTESDNWIEFLEEKELLEERESA